MAARKRPSTRLSVEDWLQAGYTVLAEQGVRALKVDTLCQQTGVTRGSFYWHFADIKSYRAALVDVTVQTIAIGEIFAPIANAPANSRPIA